MHLRPDYRKIAAIYADGRSGERILAHYQLERRLADELRTSTRQQRESGLYNDLYDTLVGELPDHPRRTGDTEATRERKRRYCERQAKLIRRYTRPDDAFLDVGGGDCKVALLMAPHVAKSIVLDVSDKLAPMAVEASNFEFVKTTGVQVPLASDSVSFIYSNQLMEHLHPEDAVEQLRELYRVLKPGGVYMCRTPNRVTGPHDVSRYFDEVAHGTHMREYCYAELDHIFRDAGFVKTRVVVAPQAHRFFGLPKKIALALEGAFARVPRPLHTAICRSRVTRALMGITMIAEKPL
jgi:ubiquinone/menaquinone biosynthesis C-methylase UbiE